MSLFGPIAVVLVIIAVTGSSAGLLVGMKPGWRTSWSSSTSGRHSHLGGKTRGPVLAAVVVVSAAFGPDGFILIVIVSQAAARACWRAQSCGRRPAGGPPAIALAAVTVVLVARCEDQH